MTPGVNGAQTGGCPTGCSGARGTELTLGETPLLDLGAIRKADWVLTTYETPRDYQHSFGRIPWSVGVFDEAWKIKNPAARLTEAALPMNIDFVDVYLPIAWHPRFADFSFDVRLDALLEKKRKMNRRVLAPSTASEGDVSQLLDETTEHALKFARATPDSVDVD